MRTYTILASILVHLCAAFAIFVSSVVATDTLPEPRRATEFIVVRPELPAPPPVARRPVDRQAAVTPSHDAAPVVAPEGVQPERLPDSFGDMPEPNGVIGSGLTSDPLPQDVQAPPVPAPRPAPPVRVGGNIQPPIKIHHVTPTYPPIAQQAHVTGIVILEALIGVDGSMQDVKVLKGHPLLDQAAVDAVRQWRFMPTLLNGQPVPVVMTVTVAFGLQ